MNHTVYIGADFGGTKIFTGAINSNGKVLCEPVQVPTNGADKAYNIVKRLKDSIDSVLNKIDTGIYEIGGIGLGVTGPLDINNGVILECPQLPTLHNFSLRNEISKHYSSIPVFMNNDANCLIYGETLFGSGGGKDVVVGFTLGTGLGCAIIINRKIFLGHTESAGEIWTSPYKKGIIEDMVSGAGVSKIYKNICGADKTSLEIFQLATKGDQNALKTWEEFGEHLAVAMSWTVNVIDPEIVILGGSVAKAYRFFAPSMEKNLRKNICPVPAERIKVVTAGLGDYAGFIGAASLAL